MVLRVQPQRRLERRDRLARPAGQHVAAADLGVRVGQAGVEADGALEMVERTIRIAQQDLGAAGEQVPAAVQRVRLDRAQRQVAKRQDLVAGAPLPPHVVPGPPGEVDQRLGRLRVLVDGLGEQPAGLLCVGVGQPVHVPAAPPDDAPAVQPAAPPAPCARLLGPAHPPFERGDDARGHLLERGHEVGELHVVLARPEDVGRVAVDEARRHPQLLADDAQAALQQVARAEQAADLARAHGRPAQGEARVAVDDGQPPQVGEPRRQVLAQAVGQVVVLRIAGDVVERQHGERRPAAEARHRLPHVDDRQRRRALGQVRLRHHHLQHLDRALDVLERQLAQRAKAELGGVADPGADQARRDDAADRAGLLQAHGDVHALAVQNAVVLLDHLAKVDAGAEPHALHVGHDAVALPDRALHRDGAAQRLDGRGELDHEAVAGAAEHAAAVPADQAVDDLAAGAQHGHRPAGVVGDHAAVVDHVRGQDRRQARRITLWHGHFDVEPPSPIDVEYQMTAD